MNKKLVLGCFVVLVFFCWKEQAALLKWKDQVVQMTKKLASPHDAEVVQEQDVPAPESPSAVPAKTVADSPPEQLKSAAAAPPAAVLPPPPEGVYYLAERIKMVTATGVRAFQAGLEVKMISENDNMAVVSDGTSTFSVATNKLTRDLALVMEIRKRDSPVASAHPAALPPANSLPQAPPATRNSASVLKAQDDAARRQITNQIENADRRIAQLTKQINDAANQVNHARNSGRSSSAGALIPSWQQEVASLQAARATLVTRLNF